MNKIWLYFGIFLACSGIGTGFGIFLIIVYFWNDVKQFIIENQNELKKDSILDPKFYDKDTVEEMR